MKHNSSEHWHQAEAAREAAREIDRIDLYDTVMVDYESSVAIQTDTSDRIRDLLALTNYYHREFGVHFEKRYAYRTQLYRVLTGELSSVDNARLEAYAQYGMTEGFGLPRVERFANQPLKTLPENRIAS